eukprot:TRINITY_DN2097_c1_g2_i1.p1 TRINITY_DN2097_c1_g2~~TRINITY_DN2097_c1_g2_i1.p1  ORF type:complete len:101 (-),score=18.51 TRINITY_DN2097_c1_g2_i1:157-459(-)
MMTAPRIVCVWESDEMFVSGKLNGGYHASGERADYHTLAVEETERGGIQRVRRDKFSNTVDEQQEQQEQAHYRLRTRNTIRTSPVSNCGEQQQERHQHHS